MNRVAFLGVVVLLLAVGCAGPSGSATVGFSPDPTAVATAANPWRSSPARSDQAVALLEGRSIHRHDLWSPLIESSGGRVLAETILDQMLARKLAERGLTVGEEQLAAERSLLADTLDPGDPDRAVRLLQRLRQQRGLGEYRFRQLLMRNAGLRLLVKDEVTVSDAAIQQAYQLEHGLRYEVRLITTASLTTAAELVHRTRAGESFTDLAIAHSTDASRAQGGLLGPVSAADSTYPQGIRAALGQLQPGQVTDPIALDEGFALLQLERVVPGDRIELATVRQLLADRVRRRFERILMQRLARSLVDAADVIVLDPLLDRSWQQHRRQQTQTEE